MTRKKYVKRLMGEGHSRNEANAMAREVVEEGRSYQEDYDELADWFALGIDLDALNDAFRKFGEATSKVCNALSAAFAAFGETLREGLAQE